MIINLIGTEDGEQAAMAAACANAIRWTGNHNADIYINPRKPDGWLEYHIVIKRKEDNSRYMTIGMVQRDIGQPYEFHS